MLWQPWGLVDDDPEDPREQFRAAKGLTSIDPAKLCHELTSVVARVSYSHKRVHATLFGARCAIDGQMPLHGFNYCSPSAPGSPIGAETCAETAARAQRNVAAMLALIDSGGADYAASLTLWRPWRMTKAMMEVAIRAIDTVADYGYIVCIGDQMPHLPCFLTTHAYLRSVSVHSVAHRNYVLTEETSAIHVYVKEPHRTLLHDGEKGAPLRSATSPPFLEGSLSVGDLPNYISPDVMRAEFLKAYGPATALSPATLQTSDCESDEEEEDTAPPLKPLAKSFRPPPLVRSASFAGRGNRSIESPASPEALNQSSKSDRTRLAAIIRRAFIARVPPLHK